MTAASRIAGAAWLILLAGLLAPPSSAAVEQAWPSALPAGWIDAGRHADFRAAVAAAAGATLVVSTPVAVRETMAISEDVGILVTNGGCFSVPPSATLRIDGPFSAPAVRIFAGGGVVRFGPRAVEGIRPQWWGAIGDGAHDDTEALKASIRAASASGKPLLLGAGTFRISDTLVKEESFDCPDILGEGWNVTRIAAPALASKPLLKIKGGSGRLCGATVRGIALAGNRTTTGIVVAGQGGIDIEACRFDNNAIGIEFLNEAPGGFTEHAVAVRCDFAAACRTAVAYTVAGGADSFHGSGMIRCTVNSDGNAPAVRIGPGANVYNAPADFTAWTWGDATLVSSESAFDATLYGSIRVERMRAAVTVAGGPGPGRIVMTGQILANGEAVRLGTLVLASASRKLPDGTTGFAGALGAAKYPLKAGRTATASSFGRAALMSVTLLGAGYDRRYLLAVSHDGYGGAGTAVVLATLKEIDTAGYGAPRFSVDGAGTLIVVNERFPRNGVVAYIDAIQAGQLPQNHNGRTMGVEW